MTSQVGAYASLAELRGAQARLGERRRQEAESPALWQNVEDFVRRGAATGVVLDSEEERWSVQGVLDYWAAALERAGRPRGDSSLAEFDAEQAPELPDDACPYLGLNAFQEANSQVFFGRDALLDRLVHHLGEHRLVALVGPSGCGKSSLAFAGLLGRLRRGALPGSQAWSILPPMVPGAAPRAALASRLADHARAHAEAAGTAALVIVVDQFEELFTMCESEAERAGFVDDLRALVTSASPPHRVILTVRSDFESFVARHPALYERYAAGRIAVTPPGAAELRQAIEGPADLVGLKFEAGVVDGLLQELVGEPAGLPLLQFTLLRLWEERHRNRVTLACYERVGGGRQALARTADAIFDAMIHEDQETARRIVLLVGMAVDDKHELTRTRVPRSRFVEGGEDPGRVERVLDRLIQARLLRQTISQQDAEPQVEVAHEALVRNWPRLVEWLQEAQTSLTERRRLEAQAREWVRLGRGTSALLDDVELREAERWLASAAGIGLRASSDLLALIAKSRQRVASSVRRHRWMIAGLAMIAIALLVMLAIVLLQYRIAEQERAAQERHRSVADRLRSEADHLLGMANLEQGRALLLDGGISHPMRALPYFVAAREAGINTPALRMLFAQAAQSTPQVAFQGHDSAVRRAVFSPDGMRVLTASLDKTVRVWDVTTGRPVIAPIEHRDPVTVVTFNPDGTRILTVNGEKNVQVWDANTGKAVLPLFIHPDPVTDAVFSADGRRVITVDEFRTVRVWDATTWHPMTTPITRYNYVTVAALSPNGARVVTAGFDDKAARVWDASTGAPVTPPLEHLGRITAVAFSADGRWVVTGSDDRTARIWDARTGKLATALIGHQGQVTDVAFSADGTWVVTASNDKTAQVWDARTGKPVIVPFEHQSRVMAAAFSSDGAHVVTASEDKVAWVWDTRKGTPVSVVFGDKFFDEALSRMYEPPFEKPGELINPPRLAFADENLDMMAFSPDGTRVLTARNAAAVQVWDARTGEPVTEPMGAGGNITTATFSADGTRVVTANADRTAQVWDATTGKPVTAQFKHRDHVNSAAFSPDSTRVVTASDDRTARVWDARTGSPVSVLEHDGAVTAAAFSSDGMRLVTATPGIAGEIPSRVWVWDVRTAKLVIPPLENQTLVTRAAFSPDGTRLVTASRDHTARVWDAWTGKPVTAPLKHQGVVTSSVFSPDGSQLVTASWDYTARVWDAWTGRPVTSPLDHQGFVTSAVFSPDGTRVVTASEDHTARVWDASTGKPVTPPLKHSTVVYAATFSPDGARVLVGGKYNTARAWDIPIDNGSLEHWRSIARCSPFAINDDGVLTTNATPLTLCPSH